MLTSLARVTAVALASTALATAIPPGTLTACEIADPLHKGSAGVLPKNHNNVCSVALGGHNVLRRSNDTEIVGGIHCGAFVQ